MKISLTQKQLRFTGPGGSLLVPNDDEVCRRLAMLIEGECEGLGPCQAAQKYDFTRQRYYQILAAFYEAGAEGLRLHPPGPQNDYRRTQQVVRLVIRCRFLDPEASPAVIAQKIRQQNHAISQRSVERIIADYGLQKKTLRPQSRQPAPVCSDPAHSQQGALGASRPQKPGAAGPPDTGRQNLRQSSGHLAAAA